MTKESIDATIAEQLKGHQPTDPERSKYTNFIPEQLISSLIARDLEYDRQSNMISDLNKKLDEFRSTCDFLGKTVKEQSDTLNNREKVVQETEHERDEALQRIDELTAVHEKVKADALAAIQRGGDISPQVFAESLDLYSLAVARISSTDAHPQIVVALVQMAMHMRGLKDMGEVLTWLRGSR